MTHGKKRICQVLVVDDYDGDQLLLALTLKKTAQLHLVHQAKSGQEAIDYLQGNGRFRDRKLFPLPQLLMLDLKMPGVDGFSVLEWLRANPIPNLMIFILTGSENPKDKTRASGLGADAFFNKQPMIEQNRQVISDIEQLVATRLNAVNN